MLFGEDREGGTEGSEGRGAGNGEETGWELEVGVGVGFLVLGLGFYLGGDFVQGFLEELVEVEVLAELLSGDVFEGEF